MHADSYQLVLDGKFADSRTWTYAESITNKDKIAWVPKLDAETFVHSIVQMNDAEKSDSKRG